MPIYQTLFYDYIQKDISDPVLLIHGFLGASNDMTPLIPPNTTPNITSNRSVLIIELPGHHRSSDFDFDLIDSSSQINASPFQKFADLLIGLCNTLNISKLHVFGYSLGGRIALSLAHYHPHRIQSLIIESAHPGLIAPERMRHRINDDHSTASNILTDFPSFLLNWHTLPLFNLSAMPHLVEHLLSQRRTLSPKPISRCLTAFSLGRQPDFRSVFSSHPISYISGEADTAYASLSRELEHTFPHQRYYRIPGAGHNTKLWQDGLITCQSLIQNLA